MPKEQSKDEFLYYQLIRPYATYLQKLLTNNPSMKYNSLTSLKREQIWKLINSFKCLLKVTDNIIPILRYFSDDYMELIIFFVKVVDF